MSRQAPDVSAPIVGADGHGYVQVRSSAETWNYLPCGNGSGSQSETLTVLRVSATGSVSVVPVHEYSGPLSADGSRTDLWVGSLAASEDAVVATWEKTETGGSGPTTTARATVLGAGAPTTYELTAERAGPVLVGVDNRAFTVSATGVVAYNATTGAVSWTAPVSGVPALATEDGGVMVWASDGTLTPVDGAGVVGPATLLLLAGPVYWGAGTWYGQAADVVVAMEGPRAIEAHYWFDPQPQRGNANRQAAPAITWWGLRLVGDERTRQQLLWLFQDALAQDSGVGPRPDGQSWLWADKQGFLRILGDRIDEFKGLGEIVQRPPSLPSDVSPEIPFPTGQGITNDIGMLVRREGRPIIEVGLTVQSLQGAYTFDCGQTTAADLPEVPARQNSGYGTDGPQILFNLTELANLNATWTTGLWKNSRFYGQDAQPAWVVKSFVWDLNDSQGLRIAEALWHELGHAWGASHGRSISASETAYEAVGWENLMRFKKYEAFGPSSALCRRRSFCRGTTTADEPTTTRPSSDESLTDQPGPQSECASRTASKLKVPDRRFLPGSSGAVGCCLLATPPPDWRSRPCTQVFEAGRRHV